MHFPSVGALAVVAAALPSFAHAATFTLDSGLDYPRSWSAEPCQCVSTQNTCTLRAAVQTANTCPGDDVIVLGAAVVYRLNWGGSGEDNATIGDLDVRENLRIVAGGGNTIMALPSLGDRMFDVIPMNPQVELTFDQVVLENGETAAGEGGGGVRVRYGSLTLDHSTIQHCSSSLRGGGVYADQESRLQIRGSTLLENDAGRGLGGGIFINEGSVLIQDGSVIQGNEAYDGGGMYVVDASTTLEGSTFVGNTAGRGGGALWLNGDTSANNVRISNNVAEYAGGVLVYFAELVGSQVQVDTNLARVDGGGFYGHSGSRIELDHSTIESNEALNDGGGIYSRSLTYLFNASVWNNRARTGSAIWNRLSSAFAFGNNVSITENPTTGVGGFGIMTQLTRLRNSIVEQNGAADCSFGVQSLGHVISPDNTCLAGGASGNINAFANVIPVSTPNGTVLTITASSLAVDAGDNATCETDDQLYTARPQGASCDMGAHELIP